MKSILSLLKNALSCIRRIMQAQLFSLPLVVLVFPTAIVMCSAVAFLCGGVVSLWQGIAGMLTASTLAILGGPTWRQGIKRMGWLWLIIVGCFLLDSCFVIFSWWDAQAYHLPAADFLVRGWNPVFDATREELLAALHLNPATFNPYHAAYLPRAGWIYSAVSYLFTGNIESGDTLILLTAISLGGVAWKTAPLLFQIYGKFRLFYTSILMLAPGCVVSAFCGAQDGSLYSLMLIMLLTSCVYRKTADPRWLIYTVVALIIGTNLKFTGVISAVISGSVFMIPITWSVIKKTRPATYLTRWIVAYVCGAIFALTVGFSPYLTNWIQFGGPFYPQHTFSTDVELPAMTEDFNLINDDAAAMGYVGRTVNAYISKWAAHRYYEWKLGKKDFHPVFHLDQVGGLGGSFRGVMILTLILLLVTRRCPVPWLLVVIIISSFLQPARFIGYVRYVPQLWLFPVILAINGFTKNKLSSPILGRILSIAILVLLSVSTYVVLIGKMIIATGLSIYTFSIITALQEEVAPKAYVLSLHDRYRQDGRCLAAWQNLPKDIPSPHLFDYYYHRILPEFGLKRVDWQTPLEMANHLTNQTPRFVISEHLWVWPQNPTKVKCQQMYYFAGPPRKYLDLKSSLSICRDILPELPLYLYSVLRYRVKQCKENWTSAK